MKLLGLFFVLCLPALAAIGFDIWLAYGETRDFSKPLELSSVGWLWVKYAGDNYNTMRQTIEPETWASIIKPILSQKMVTIALLPVFIAIPVLLVMKTFGWGSYEGNGLFKARSFKKGGKGKGFTYQADMGDGPKKKMKYNRK